MRNFFKPNNSDGGQNPSRRNSEQTNLSENIATIRRTGVNTMTARKSIYTIIAAISVALVATVALVSIGNIGAQNAASRLADIPTPSCGGAGEADCSTGRIYAASRLAGLTNSSGADELDLDYTGPSGVVDLTLDYVGDGNSLYATYANEENVILDDADTLIVVVEDADAIAARTVGFDLATLSGLSGNIAAAQRVSILLSPGTYSDDLPILDADGDGDLRDDVILFLDADSDNVFDDGEEFEANNTAAYRIDSVDPGLNGAFATIDITVFAMEAVADLAVTWETADMDNRVVVEVDSSQRGAGSTFLSIAETSRGSGRFVGEIQLVDSADETNQTNYDVYEDATSSAALSIDTVNITVTAASGATSTVRVVDGTQEVVPLPVDSRSSVTFRYLDKTGEDNSGRDQTTTRSTTVAIDADAPEITVDLPVNESATSSRRPTFEGSVADAGGSGLDVESLRLAIDNTYNDIATANVDEAAANAVDIAGAISNLGYFTRNSGYDVAAVDNTAGSASDPRVLVGSDDPTSGLYAADTDYEDGADAVDFSYTPSNAQRLLTDEELSSIDQQVDFQLFVYDVAGNVGISDSDPDDDGAAMSGIEDDFQPHVFSIDGSRPILVDTDSGQRGAAFPITVYPGTDNSDVRLFDSTQTGLVWDNGDREFRIDSNFIMVVFNDRVVGAAPGDFDVDFSTAGVADPTILRVVVPVNVTPDDFVDPASTTTPPALHADAAEIARVLGNSVFIELSTSIPPADQPVVTVTGVDDSAGNSINTDANTEPANDGLGPEVSVSISDGTGVGSDADGTGPGTLTRNAITIEVTSNEAGVPRLEFFQLVPDTSTPNDPDDVIPASRSTRDAREISDANGIFRYEYDFTPVRVDNIVDGDVCVVVSVADDAGNPATRGVNDCANNDAIGFTVDTDGPDLDTADFQTPAGGIATQTEYEQRPQVRIPFDEDVQADSVEVRIDGDDVPASRISSSSASSFVYQPSTDLDFDTYRIEVRATDLAGNEGSFDAFNLVIEERGDFIVGLSAGWNLISFPSDPINPAVNSVFSNDAVQTVSTFDAANFRNGDMQANRSAATGNFSGSLTSVRAGLAYWVFADNPTDLEVALLGPSSASNAARPGLTVIPTIPGVNLVGVVDTSRSNANTQGDIVGNPLTRRAADAAGAVTDENVTIATYLGETDYSRVYSYDSTRRQFVLLNDGADIEIGTGLLVFINADSSGRTAPIVP